VVALLFLAQTLIGGATAHYRAEPESFYGIDLSPFLPSNILRTWHLQLAIFWIATAYVAGALLLAADLGGREPKRQATLINILFVGLVTLVVGSLFPGGVLQLIDVLEKGYWHARSLPYTGQATARLIEWLRTPGDLVFIFVGVVPALIAVTLSYFGTRVDSMDFGVSAVGRREVDEK
jgi:nitric oxide reductase large subunit